MPASESGLAGTSEWPVDDGLNNVVRKNVQEHNIIPRLRERWRQVEVEVVINSSDTILQTWELLLATQVEQSLWKSPVGLSVGRTDGRGQPVVGAPQYVCGLTHMAQ